MATIDDFYPAKFLKPADLDGEDVFVTVHEVGKDTFKNDDGTEVRKPIIYWRENVKPLIVNKTNFVRISEVAGRDTDDWSGTRLVLYADRVAMHGKSVDTIRVRPAPKAKSKPVVSEIDPPPFDDPIG